MAKNRQIEVKGIVVTISERNNDDFISLTDVANGFDGGYTLVEKWIRNKNTIEFLAVWEQLNNPSFNNLGYNEVLDEVGTNRFIMSAKKWVSVTNAIGIYASAGRYGGTYARTEIAFEFCTWLNPFLKIISIRQIIEGQDYNFIFKDIFNTQNIKIEQSCYLYLMQDLSTMLYKIGISKTPIYREKTLQSEKPSINMIYSKEFIDRKTAYFMEQNIHTNFKKNRIRGEWFSFSSIELKQIEGYFLN